MKPQTIATLLLCAAGLLSVTGQAAAQDPFDTGDIRGYVKDAESGEALPFANVMLKGTTHGAMTANNGYFVLVNAPAGICSLQVSYIGYETQVIRVDNRPGEMEPIIVEMSPRILELEGVTVTAYKEEMLRTTDRVSQVTLAPSQLTTLPSIGEVDIFRSLQLLPGISGVSDGSSGLYVRGGTPDQNLVLFDGMTIYHVDHFFGFFSAFNADAVKNVQVYKGGYPAKYGGRLSSVVNLTGKTGDRYRPQLGAGVNLLSAHAIVELPLSSQSTLLVAARRSYTDFIQSNLYEKIYDSLTGSQSTGRTGGGVQQGGGGRNVLAGEYRPDFYFFDANAKLTLVNSPENIVSFSFYTGADNLDRSQDFGDFGFQIPGGGGEDSDLTLSTGDITRWGNLGFSGNWSRQWHDRFSTELLVARSHYFSEYDRNSTLNNIFGAQQDSVGVSRGLTSASEENNDVKDLTYRLDANWHAGAAHDVEFGVWVSDFGADYRATLNDTLELIDRNQSAWLNAAYIQDTWRIGKAELTTGVRGTDFTQSDRIHFEPRASLTYSLTDRLQLKGAWGHYYQFVNRIVNENVLEGSRDFWLLADDELRPGFSEHFIAGASYETGNYLLSVEGYRKDLENVVEFSRRIRRREGGGSYFFLGTGVAEGLELLLQKKRGLTTGWIGYTLGRVEHRFPDFNNGVAFPADHDRRHEINTVVRSTVGEWTFAATWTFATGRAFTAPESQYYITLLDGQSLSNIHVSGKNANRLPNYHRLDVSASRKWELKNWITELGVSIFNVYNHRNVWYREYQLDTTPITVIDALMLGFAPTVYVQFKLK